MFFLLSGDIEVGQYADYTLTSAQFTFTFSRGPRPKSRCISRRLCRQLHIKVLKNREILAGTFLNLPDKAIRTLKVVASHRNFYETASRAQFLSIFGRRKKCYPAMKAHD